MALHALNLSQRSTGLTESAVWVGIMSGAGALHVPCASVRARAPRGNTGEQFASRCDERGVVMVEFIFASIPLFLLFFGAVQLSLASAAQIVVQHAASVAVRSAVVVLEDEPRHYSDAPRGDLCSGERRRVSGVERLLGITRGGRAAARGPRLVGIVDDREAGEPRESAGEEEHDPFGALRARMRGDSAGRRDGSGQSPGSCGQTGARMSAIRDATYIPLLSLAPSASSLARTDDGNVFAALSSSGVHQLMFALDYARAAAAITVHDGDSAPDEVPPDALARDALVVARVTYLFHCGIPVVSALICKRVESLLAAGSPRFPRITRGSGPTVAERMSFAEHRGELSSLVGPNDRFMVLEGQASLPNQGADYVDNGEAEQAAPRTGISSGIGMGLGL